MDYFWSVGGMTDITRTKCLDFAVLINCVGVACSFPTVFSWASDKINKESVLLFVLLWTRPLAVADTVT